ncbi:TonB-dependent receptor domain-containing protein [Novosphingobium sp. KA1]|uniref:TonB-dependent receptor domain-containing protein n=1 Tax=Novosphingobium sp. (strain KA1) TaxID=164608 RepID=UPI001A8E0F64|nr:TonB-dependent receptor [Novosphingobium sp. KA1]QSR17991.1 TonB-dependent receptor [Novosphingobium sp. KA1]
MNTTLKKAALRSATCVAAFAIGTTGAYAQDAEADAAAANPAQEIVVTGSLIRNPNLQSNPVLTTTADQIELKQSNTAEDILREIPGIVPSVGSAVNNGNGGASFVNLRGLGSNRNLVLLNGDRLVPAELNGRFDLNNIPVALVERVDVLTGGASTTYGADAISGVVNFIVKSDFTGLEANVSNQITERGDGAYVRADLTMGADFDDGKGNVVFAVGYQQSDPVYQGDRGFAASSIDSYSGDISGSGTSSPSRFSNVNVTGTDNGNGTRQVTADGTGFRSTSAFDAFNFNPYNIFQTPFERFNMFGQAKYEVSDAVEVYTRGIFSKNTVKTIIAPSGSFSGLSVVIPLSNPYMTAAQRNAFCARDMDMDPDNGIYTPLYTQAQCDAAAVATDPNDPNYRTVTTGLYRRATEFGPRVSEFTTTFFDYKAGARGGITDSINWDVSGAYGESENIQTQKGYWLNSRVRNALLATNTDTCLDGSDDCVPLNVFGPDGSITDAMNQYLTANSQVVTKTSLAQVRGLINGDIGWNVPWASDSVAFAIGAEYRKYTASQESDLLSQSGDLGGSGGASPNISGGYDVYEAYGELVVPIVQDKPFFEELTAQGGARYSSYTVDAPGKPGYKTWTWNVGGTWAPVRAFKIRGNYAHAVRAPNIAELFAPNNTGLTNLAVDPCAGSAPLTNANLAAVCTAQGGGAYLGLIENDPAGQVNYTSGGNLALKPEKSNSWKLGAVFQPDFLPGFSATVDYYNIKVTDAITQPTPGDAISACFDNLTAASATSAACTMIQRDPSSGNLFGEAATTPGLFLGLTNQGTLKTDGIDFTVNYGHDLGFAQLSLALNGNWTGSSKFKASPTSINRDCVGYYSVNCASIQPEWQFSERTTLSFKDFDVSLLWRYIDKVTYEPAAYADDLAAANAANEGLALALQPCPDPEGADAGGCMVNSEYRKIPAKSYFDLSGRVHLNENLTLTLTVQNLLDTKPKVVGSTIGATAYNSGNVYPSTYDTLGRRYAAALKFNF